MTQYKLYDDMGTMTTGSLGKCLDVFEVWSKSKHARSLYTAMELAELRNRFNGLYGCEKLKVICIAAFTIEVVES